MGKRDRKTSLEKRRRRLKNNITREAITYGVNVEARSRNHCCHGEAIPVTCSECVSVALIIQHAVRMPHIVSSVACLAVQYFHTSSHTGRDIKKKNRT